jgi:hypothetical protein
VNGNEQREALAKVIRLFSVEPSRASGEGGMASNESTGPSGEGRSQVVRIKEKAG